MKYQTIITPTKLADNLHKSNWLILDCRRCLLSDSESYNTYMYQHIPNAYYCAANGYDSEELTSKIYNSSLSESAQIIAELEAIGFNLNTQIIIYEDLNSSLTDSLWLKLRSLGINNVAVLQGGFTSWQEQDLPTTIFNQQYKHEDQMIKYDER